MPPVDYLLIGHVCRDLTADGPRLGGTVSFGALMAHALGLRVGVVTSTPDDMEPLLAPLASVAGLVRIPAPTATTFINTYSDAGRTQILSSRAADLSLEHVPPRWHEASIVHLAPVAGEVDPALAGSFPNSLVGATPQGWMRAWDATGRVRFTVWEGAGSVLSTGVAVVLSIEDVQGDESIIADLAQQTRVLVVTRGPAGSTLYVDGEAQSVPSDPLSEVDPTGAGDIFATAFFSHLHATGDPLRAAHFATFLARDSVQRVGLESIPLPDTIQSAREQA
jgi:sugar/nucleoside kinase (ribokinase family)